MAGIPQWVLDQNKDDEPHDDNDDLQLAGGDELPDDSGDESQAFDGDGSDVTAHDEASNQGNDAADSSATPGGENWEQRAKVAEGRLRTQAAEMAQLKGMISTLQGNIPTQVEHVIKQREEAAKATAEAEQRKRAARSKVNEYLDDDAVDALEQYFKPEQPAQKQQEPDAQAMQQQMLAARVQQFEADLLDAIPDYMNVINAPEFSQWSQAVDAQSGLTRYEMLVNAKENLQAGRMIAMLGQFKAVPAQSSNAAAIQSQISPGRTRGGTQAPAKPQYLTPEQIDRHYDDFRRGVYRPQAMWDKWAGIKKQIDAAERHYGIA